MSKFELLKEDSIKFCGFVLYRIRALKDFGTIKSGDLGGYIEKENNLSQDGQAWLFGNSRAFGNSRVFNNALVYSDAIIYGRAWVFGDSRIYGNAIIYGDSRIFGNAPIYGDARICGHARIDGEGQLMVLIGHQYLFSANRQNIFIASQLRTHLEWLEMSEDDGYELGLKREYYPYYYAMVELAVKTLFSLPIKTTNKQLKKFLKEEYIRQAEEIKSDT